MGEGNPKAPIMVLIDNPGAREDKEGKEFICGTRQTLQAAAFLAKLELKDMYITYLLKCRPIRKYNKEEARGKCFNYLLAKSSPSSLSLSFVWATPRSSGSLGTKWQM